MLTSLWSSTASQGGAESVLGAYCQVSKASGIWEGCVPFPPHPKESIKFVFQFPDKCSSVCVYMCVYICMYAVVLKIWAMLLRNRSHHKSHLLLFSGHGELGIVKVYALKIYFVSFPPLKK